MQRRRRQIGLFLVAAVLPAVALSILTFRYLAQNEELDRQRDPQRRQEAVEQAERELATGLETIRLEEINQRVTASDNGHESRLANGAIVFVASLDAGNVVLPWRQSSGKPSYPSPAFASNRETAEYREFQQKDFAGAAAAYRAALDAAQRREESCESRLGLARVLVKAGKPDGARDNYRQMLLDCGPAVDDAGMPYVLYAAERLVALKLDIPLAEKYLLQQIYNVPLRPLPQTAMMRSLLQSIASADAHRALTETNGQMADLQQALTLVKEFDRVRPLAEKQWISYGQEPWLLRVTSAPPLPPLLFAVSSVAVAPGGTKLTSVKTPSSRPLAGFPGLEVELDPSRFSGNPAPAALIATGIGLILILTLLSGYLLLHGVNHDLQMAELRSQFVASVSHELKTPLTAIRMFAETVVLGRTRDERTRSEYLETIMNESERLARLVDNVLDFSKIEQGKKIYRMRPTALPDVAHSAARAMEYPLSQQGFNLNVSIDEELPAFSADSDALEQAILNLLSNAMKYSGDSREIDLCCSRRNGDAVIAVTDRGIGIAPTDQPHIFEKFYRVRSSDTDLIAGTGLGLTLVKHIAQAHGGSVDVQSAPGKGSTFSIRIPAPEASA